MAFLSSGACVLRERFADLDPDARKKIFKVAACVGGLLAARHAFCYVRSSIEQKRAKRKKVDQICTTKGKLLQKLVNLKTPIDNREVLTQISYDEMKKKLEDGDLHALDLLEAFQAKSLEDAHLNGVNEMIYEADVTALYLDSLQKDEREVLHGIPLTMSDSIDMKNHDSYAGCVSHCFHPLHRTDPVAEALENAGMIPFARTNTSQHGLTWANCTNPIFGTTANPLDSKRAAGSSGGEGSVIRAGCSIAGLGVDQWGSIRISASFCGVFGFKPTAERIGEYRPRDAKGRISPVHPLFHYSCVGPLSRDLDLLVAMMRVIYSDLYFNLNPTVPRLKFDSESFDSTKPLQIGFFSEFSSNCNLKPTPSVTRILNKVKDALEARGHKVVTFNLPDLDMLSHLILQPLFLDGGGVFRDVTKREMYLSKDMKKLRFVGSLSRAMKTFLSFAVWIFSPMVSQRLWIARGLPSVSSVIDLGTAIEDYRAKFEKAWADAELDGLICPASIGAAPPLSNMPATTDPSFAMLFNLLDYPAGVVPAGLVTEEDSNNLSLTYSRRDLVTRSVANGQKTAVGLPIGLQCVSMRHHDEVALRLMREVRDVASN